MSEQTPTNVIKFPKVVERQVPTVEQIQSNIEQEREYQIDQSAELLANMLLESLSVAGFRLENNDLIVKEVCFAMEGIRALVAKYHKAEHPFHQLAATMFRVNPEDDDEIEFIADNLTIKVVEATKDDDTRPE